jgi:hypothetical protein
MDAFCKQEIHEYPCNPGKPMEPMGIDETRECQQLMIVVLIVIAVVVVCTCKVQGATCMLPQFAKHEHTNKPDERLMWCTSPQQWPISPDTTDVPTRCPEATFSKQLSTTQAQGGRMESGCSTTHPHSSRMEPQAFNLQCSNPNVLRYPTFCIAMLKPRCTGVPNGFGVQLSPWVTLVF